MRSNLLNLASFLARCLPRGRSFIINTALRLFGTKFNGVISAQSMNFYIDEINSGNRRLFFLRTIDEPETTLLKKIIKPGFVTFDLGANFGWYTILMSKLVDDGKVYAFEISPEIKSILDKNIRANHAQNVAVEGLAIGDHSGQVEIFYSKKEGTANLSEKLVSENHSRQTAEMITLDRYVAEKNIGRIDFIKCDIDGGEIPFLKGASEVLKTKPLLMMELSSRMQKPFNHSPLEILDILSEYGYRFWNIEKRSEIHRVQMNKDEEIFANILAIPDFKFKEISSIL